MSWNSRTSAEAISDVELCEHEFHKTDDALRENQLVFEFYSFNNKGSTFNFIGNWRFKILIGANLNLVLLDSTWNENKTRKAERAAQRRDSIRFNSSGSPHLPIKIRRKKFLRIFSTSFYFLEWAKGVSETRLWNYEWRKLIDAIIKFWILRWLPSVYYSK